MTKQEFVEYVRSHKKEIAMGALGLVGTGLLVALGVNISKSIKVSNSPVDLIGEIVSDSDWKERNLVEGFTTGKVNELWNEGGYTWMCHSEWSYYQGHGCPWREP